MEGKPQPEEVPAPLEPIKLGAYMRLVSELHRQMRAGEITVAEELARKAAAAAQLSKIP